MLIPAEKILDIAIGLCDQFQPPKRISSLEFDEENDEEFDEGKWRLFLDEDLTCSEQENIRILMMALLRSTSRIIPNQISSQLMMAHLSMLCPNLPIDFIPIVEAALNERIESIATFKRWLSQAAELQKDRLLTQKIDRLDWNIGHDTHIGRRKSWASQTNQDNFFYAVHNQVAMFMVADGISTSTAGSGDIASHVAVRVAYHFWEEGKDTYPTMQSNELQSELYTILENINHNICDIAIQRAPNGIEKEIPMGTTIVIGIAVGANVTIASLGDSRVYALLESGLAQITGDQNLRGERLRHHIALKNEIEGSELVRYLGRFSMIDGKLEPEMLPPDFFNLTLLPGEGLLFCSDGVTDFLGNNYHECHQILQDLTQNNDPMEVCWALTRQANRGGGGDNITSVVTRLQLID